ncbi:MAG: Ig-like domain-containing domain [Bacteroidota bacterium]
MDRFFRISICFLTGLWLSACATVGVIEGGEKDTTAPKPVENGVQPPSGSVNFNSRQIIIQFDEYFKLNNPQENIAILPLGPAVEARAEKKRLILTIEGNLKANTTYQITFNNAIKDLNEGNDSLMRYVFSTGPFIDSLSYKGKVADAYTGEAASAFLVGLYQDGDAIDSVKPRYFAKTNRAGEFELDYLSTGTYRVYAFNDLNKDLRFQTAEKTGFKEKLLVLDSSYTDSVAIRVFQNPQTKKITHKSFVPPSQIRLGANFDLSTSRFYYEGEEIDPERIYQYRTDSITFSLPKRPADDFHLTTDFQADTLFFRLNPKIKTVQYEVFPKDKDLTQSQEISFLFSQPILAFDADSIGLLAGDSTPVLPEFSFKHNRFIVKLEKKPVRSLQIKFLAGAIQFTDSTFSDSIHETFTAKEEREFGSIVLVNFNPGASCVLELLKENKLVRQVSCAALESKPVLSYVEGGEYTFRLVLDENQNGKWDGGDVLRHKPAEKVLYFPEKAKVRANWETEVELQFSPEN